jgi:aminopeptidase
VDDRLTRYARLAVKVGLNLQPGQTLVVVGQLEHAPLVRAIASEAYDAGARYVDVAYADQHVRKAHIAAASDDMLAYSPPWAVQRMRELGAEGGALCSISGNPEPELFADLDGGRVGRSRPRELSEATLELTDGRCNWTIVAFPNEGWARTVFGEPDVERLWQAVASAVRLDADDPVAAWRDHMNRLEGRAAALNERRFDHLRYRGPGTDLTIGLHPDGMWEAASMQSNGIRHVPNMPTEEVFTCPDARRVDGTVRSTLPLQIQSTIVKGLEIRFEGGRAVDVRAESGESLMQTHVQIDDGAARLGEVALVDRSSAVGQTGLVFYDTLFDENASSHIALGDGFPENVPSSHGLAGEERHARGVNHSSIHTDFMIGSDELEVDGVSADGEAVPILRHGDWQLG